MALTILKGSFLRLPNLASHFRVASHPLSSRFSSSETGKDSGRLKPLLLCRRGEIAMWSSSGNSSQPQAKKQEGKSISGSFKAENLIPGVVIGFIIGMLLDFSQQVKLPVKRSRLLSSKTQNQSSVPSNGSEKELKMVLVVRQDLKMRTGKIASQCAHAATGMYAQLMQSDRYRLRQWEECGQPKIAVTCKNQQEMNKIAEAAESVGLPTFVVADAGRTEVAAGSRTVLAVGPGPKQLVDSITGKLALL